MEGAGAASSTRVCGPGKTLPRREWKSWSSHRTYIWPIQEARWCSCSSDDFGGERMRIDLGGKVALVTGASKGIGRAIALELAMAGTNLAICARGRGLLEEVAGEIRGHGREVEAVVADVATIEGAARVLERART